ncbi:MAG: hypothetical protein JXR37_22790 [Kiritimatiellae bacterium]|nr:hypothetical protein [Kiritimatiellia bacterium]
MSIWLRLILLAVLLEPGARAFAQPAGARAEPARRRDRQVRWLHLKYGNRALEKDPDAWPEMERRMHRAARAGYNGIVFTDHNEYWYKGDLWRQRLGELARLTRSLGMQFLVTCVPAKGGGVEAFARVWWGGARTLPP